MKNNSIENMAELIGDYLASDDYLLHSESDYLTIYLKDFDYDKDAKPRKLTNEKGALDLFNALYNKAKRVEETTDETDYFYFKSFYVVLV